MGKTKPMTVSDRYSKRGVSADKSEVHEAIKGLDEGLYPNAFCKILPDIAGGEKQFCNIMHADTAGTKTSLAYMYWKETGDLSVWHGILQDAIVMNLDDMACVGCTDDILLSSTIGRNKNLIPGEVITELIQGTATFIDQLNKLGVRIYLSGGETADVGDIVRTIDVGYTAFARMKRENVIVNNIREGDVIVGFASFGQCSYEASYNGGMGSNGLTSARHDVFEKQYAEKYPETFDPNTDREWIYTGSRSLTETVTVDGAETTLGKLVLSPTRTYLPLIKKIVEKHRDSIHGMIHCTGGAQTKVLNFIKDKHIVKDHLFKMPPLFQIIREESGTSLQEMFQVFNMGHRLECYVPERVADDLISLADSFDIRAQVIGRVEEGRGATLEINYEGQSFEYGH